jgi:hypothetical protein
MMHALHMLINNKEVHISFRLSRILASHRRSPIHCHTEIEKDISNRDGGAGKRALAWLIRLRYSRCLA